MRNVTTAWQWRFSCDPPGRRIGFTAAGRGRMRIRARGSGRQTRVRGLSEDPGSIGFAVPNMRLCRVARLIGKKNTGVQT
ncbi:hypothetical protein HEK616_04240 [Streptomyces nigrescens]|uniref:Uncharacterized protein n=1 Tax=Streptomyces nigrescens TaxID=1920 RepID=A0ABM7ZKW1_STRNI|nr:hypothetical protein HEK616_04240 [Streptomyces nigrescens]